MTAPETGHSVELSLTVPVRTTLFGDFTAPQEICSKINTIESTKYYSNFIVINFLKRL